jgi:hypothetical protein
MSFSAKGLLEGLGIGTAILAVGLVGAYAGGVYLFQPSAAILGTGLVLTVAGSIALEMVAPTALAPYSGSIVWAFSMYNLDGGTLAALTSSPIAAMGAHIGPILYGVVGAPIVFFVSAGIASSLAVSL